MTPLEITAMLKQQGCSIVEDGGDFALVHPNGYHAHRRATHLAARTLTEALREAWLIVHPDPATATRIEVIQQVVAAEYGCPVTLLQNYDRHEPLATARRLAIALCCELTASSKSGLGVAFGGREHNTVRYAETSVFDQCATDAEFRARFVGLRSACLAKLAHQNAEAEAKP